MADYVLRREEGKRDSSDIIQNSHRILQSRLLLVRQVDLRHVTRNNRMRPETDSRQEHLHLFDTRVLCFVENHE